MCQLLVCRWEAPARGRDCPSGPLCPGATWWRTAPGGPQLTCAGSTVTWQAHGETAMRHSRLAAAASPLTPIPLLPHEPVYIGIDVGKTSHVAGFVSTTLLARHERFEACPTHLFANSREGFRFLG